MKIHDAIPGVHSHLRRLNSTQPEEAVSLSSMSGLDCRVQLAAILGATLSAFLLKTQMSLVMLAVFVLLWLLSLRRIKSGITFAVLFGLLTLTVSTVTTNLAIGSILVVANIFRRMMIPAFVAMPLSKAPTGVLIASLGRLKIPRQVTIALAVMFRFMPTVAEEYHSIRTSQKFRGIGVNAWGLFRYPARSYETILVPLLIRTTRIADELSASAILRGASTERAVTSFRPVLFRRGDFVCLAVVAVVTVGIFVLDYFAKGWMV